MHASIAAAGLLCLVSNTSAHADEIKDVDKWAAQFAEAAGRSDAGSMLALIEPYSKYGPGLPKIQDLLQKIGTGFSGAKTLHVEQFNNYSIGEFARRINIAVIYDIGQEFYTLTLIKGEHGWRFYQLFLNSDIGDVPKPG